MAKLQQDKISNDQAWEARGVVAKYGIMGHYQASPILQVPVYRFLTLYQGESREAVPVEYVMPAPVMEDENGDAVLDIRPLEQGDIVVNPGLVYRKCLWNDNLMAAHMKALQTYKPKDIIVNEKADLPAVDLGTIDHTSDQVTKQ